MFVGEVVETGKLVFLYKRDDMVPFNITINSKMQKISIMKVLLCISRFPDQNVAV